MTQPKVTTYKTALILSDTRGLLGDFASACKYLSHGSASIEPLDSSGVFGVLSYAAYAAYDELVLLLVNMSTIKDIRFLGVCLYNSIERVSSNIDCSSQ